MFLLGFRDLGLSGLGFQGFRVETKKTKLGHLPVQDNAAEDTTPTVSSHRDSIRVPLSAFFGFHSGFLEGCYGVWDFGLRDYLEVHRT